ncbi:MAG: hypothetical protein JWM10_3431, partial [Myxococcaceae bacterium]|nr:hypothetical protein [Myxococcaceae bacterium]
LARAQEPGGLVVGWRGRARRFVRRASFPLRARAAVVPVQRIYLQLDAADAGTVTLDGLDPLPVHRGAQQIVATLARPQRLRVLTMRATVPVSVAMVAATPLGPAP